MSDACASIRKVLARHVDGECDPRTSYEVARHLPRCTGCRIVLAREARLREALDVLPNEIEDDAGVVDRVMDALARTPAPRSAFPVRTPRRGLRLAVFMGVCAWVGWSATQALRIAGFDGAGLRLAFPAPLSAQDALGILAHVLPMISTAFESWPPVPIPAIILPGIAIGGIAGAGFAIVAALVTAAGVLWRRVRATRTDGPG